jgi:phage baseplate assembly protein W
VSRPLEGFAFPFRIEPPRRDPPGTGHRVGGSVVRARGPEKVAADLRHLLSVRLGERLMLRTYGGGVHHRLQGPNDATLRTLIKHEMEQALRAFFPEVRLQGPLVLSSRGSELRIELEYRASADDVVRRLEIELP